MGLGICLRLSSAFASPSTPDPGAPEPASSKPHVYESRTVSEEQKKRESAEAVSVYTTERAKQQSADLGDILDRIPGVNVARTGGLGSEVRFSLNGLTNDQIRFFLNGVPLEIAGFAFGIANIPVNLVDRIEVYRGVVPLRFGADALGGAVNLVSATSVRGAGASASASAGSFGTYRGSFDAHYRNEQTGLFGSATAFIDSAKNDYDVAVQVPDTQGRLHEATVPLFHNAYGARGAIVDLGLLDRPWAKRLVLRAFYSEYEKDLQNDPVQTIPYGAVNYGETLGGASLQCVQPDALGKNVDVDVVASYSHRTIHFNDTSSNVYDWFGNVIHTRIMPGEIDGSPHKVTIWRDSIFSRLGIEWRIAPGHSLRLSSTASGVSSHGVTLAGLIPGERDPLAADRMLFKLVSGVEYQSDFLRDRIENVLFVKSYYMHASSDELLTGQVYLPVNVSDNTGGAGDGLRVRLWKKSLYAKASYEYATRLPNQTEIFGDGILTEPNGKLVPERSHNANLSLSFDVRDTLIGSFDGEINGFVRAAKNLIVLLGNLENYAYQNVYSARSLGVEGVARWRSPREWVSLEVTTTYQDIRNDSSTGAYRNYDGNRVPNMPWLFANASLRGQYRSLIKRNDELALTWFTRYVHEFDRDWSSIGAPQYKLVVDAQVSHSVSLTYMLRGATATATFAIDANNVTNARLFDVYGVQKPGRAFYGKTTIAF